VNDGILADMFANKTYLPSRKQNMMMARMIAMIITTISGRISIRRKSFPKSLTEESYTGAMYVDSSNPSPVSPCLVALLTTMGFLLLSIYQQK